MTATDAIAQVGHALRVAAAQDADAAWKADFARRKSLNHVALMFATRGLLSDPGDLGAITRARAAVAEYKALGDELAKRTGRSA